MGRTNESSGTRSLRAFLGGVLLLSCMGCETVNAGRDASPRVVGNSPIAKRAVVRGEAPTALNTEAKRSAFLRTRRSGTMNQSFRELVKAWKQDSNVPVFAEYDDIDQIKLVSPFPAFYQPTWTEYFNAIARQAHATWKWDDVRGAFVFTNPPPALPFRAELMAGWEVDYRGAYIALRPKDAPIGLDIYMLGEYSGAANNATVLDKVRDEWACEFAAPFKQAISTQDMEDWQIAGADALYFAGNHPETNYKWRQWAFVQHGQCFVIVAGFHPDSYKDYWADVLGFVASFEVLTPAELQKLQAKYDRMSLTRR